MGQFPWLQHLDPKGDEECALGSCCRPRMTTARPQYDLSQTVSLCCLIDSLQRPLILMAVTLVLMDVCRSR